MNISAPFIARPIATWLLAIAILLGGALGYRSLPVSALPEVDFPTIQVTTQLPGASPETVETLITASLERQFGQIPGLQLMTSESSQGTSQITLQFGLDESMDVAAQDVQAAINAAAGTLPANLPYPPTYAKVNPADAPILTLALTSETLPIGQVSDAADTLLQPKLSRDRRRRPRHRAGQHAPRRARARRSRAPRRLWPVDGGRAHRRRRRQRQRRQGRLRRSAPGLRAGRQRPADGCRRVPEPDHRLAQQRAGAAVRGRQRGQRRGERPRRRAL